MDTPKLSTKEIAAIRADFYKKYEAGQRQEAYQELISRDPSQANHGSPEEAYRANKNLDKKGTFGCIGIVVLIAAIFGYNAITSGDENSKSSNVLSESFNSPSTAETVTLRETASEKLAKFEKDLDLKIYVIDTSMDRAKYRHTKTDILSEVDLFDQVARLIANAPDSMSANLKKKIEYLKKRTIKIQEEDFPVLRKNYVDWSAKQVWENNVDIEFSSSNSRSISFVAGMFADRKNIKAAQETLSDVLKSLRFKYVKYKWYEYDKDLTFYEMESKDDDEL